MTLRDEQGNRLFGYIDIGGCLIPRAELAKKLPDFERFERWMDAALEADDYMTRHPEQIPPFFAELSQDNQQAVAATLQELGELQMAAAKKLQHEFDSHDPHG